MHFKFLSDQHPVFLTFISYLSSINDLFRSFNNRYKKNGAPMKAVTIPMGISTGAMMVRHNRSATSNNKAPNKADAIKRFLCSGPISLRTICGITRPTKPITPLTLTQAPTPRAVNKITFIFNFTRGMTLKSN